MAELVGHARAYPDRLAVDDGTTRLTYAELNKRASQLASRLQQSATLGPETCVGVFCERSADFVVAALGILQAGAAYLPLDPATPPERVNTILTDARAALVVSHRGLTRGWTRADWTVVELETVAAEPITNSAVEEVDPDALAYLVYTSGSTGQPNGVEITHGNLRNLIDWHRAAFAIQPDDRASQVAGLGFDAAVWEIWPHLTAGASVHFADEFTRRSPQSLRDWLVARQITVAFAPTVLAEQLLTLDWPSDTVLRFLLTGADTLHKRPSAKLPFALVNNYGPSECTVVATSGTVESAEEQGGQPAIGRPITGAIVQILDEALQPVAAGEVGELFLGGRIVGRGYRNRPELQAARFLDVALSDGEPGRLYRTGDRARQLPDGSLAFHGRVDDQVKIRGYRIEVGEIVSWLDRIPGIRASAVIVRDDEGIASESVGPALVAYVVAAKDLRLSASDLRSFLADRLPEYMIPSRFVILAELPTTPNGKLDRRALPEPGPDNLLLDEAVSTKDAGSEVESAIGGLVASLLGVPAVDHDANIFMVGGHSMFGVQLVTRIRDLFGVKLTLRQLFGSPTIAKLSAEVERLLQAVTAGSTPR